jgi:hypothetical protein
MYLADRNVNRTGKLGQSVYQRPHCPRTQPEAFEIHKGANAQALLLAEFLHVPRRTLKAGFLFGESYENIGVVVRCALESFVERRKQRRAAPMSADDDRGIGLTSQFADHVGRITAHTLFLDLTAGFFEQGVYRGLPHFRLHDARSNRA